MADDGPGKAESPPPSAPVPEVAIPPPAPEVAELDLEATDDATPATVAAETPPAPSSKPYDPLPDRENVRGRIAQGLILILAILILFAFLTIWACPWATPALKDLLTLLFGPVAALVGSAIGFYFGGGSGQK